MRSQATCRSTRTAPSCRAPDDTTDPEASAPLVENVSMYAVGVGRSRGVVLSESG